MWDTKVLSLFFLSPRYNVNGSSKLFQRDIYWVIPTFPSWTLCRSYLYCSIGVQPWKTDVARAGNAGGSYSESLLPETMKPRALTAGEEKEKCMVDLEAWNVSLKILRDKNKLDPLQLWSDPWYITWICLPVFCLMLYFARCPQCSFHLHET